VGPTAPADFESSLYFEPWLSRWALAPDGDAIVTHSSRLLPVRRHGEPAMLKLPEVEDERLGYRLLEYWDGDGAARLHRPRRSAAPC
jgi:streptomycin 6-kinase